MSDSNPVDDFENFLERLERSHRSAPVGPYFAGAAIEPDAEADEDAPEAPADLEATRATTDRDDGHVRREIFVTAESRGWPPIKLPATRDTWVWLMATATPPMLGELRRGLRL